MCVRIGVRVCIYAPVQAYYQFLRNMCYLAPVGWVLCMIRPGVKGTSNNATDTASPTIFRKTGGGEPYASVRLRKAFVSS